MAEAPGLRDRKKMATRRALASAALHLAADKGPSAVTVEAISAAADVSPRTFFNHFASKEDAIVGADPERAAHLRAHLEARPAHEPPLQALRAAVEEASTSLTDGAADWNLRMRLVREHPSLFPRYVAAFAEVERGLAEAVAERAGLDADRDLYPSLVVAVATTAMRVAVERWQAAERAVPLDELLAEAFTHLAGGLAAPEPRPLAAAR